MNWVICLQANGEILRGYFGVAEDVGLQCAAGEMAVLGSGCWRTHRVVDGKVVALESTRVPPFDGAAWCAAQAAWVDPMLSPETARHARQELRAQLLVQMAGLESQQARPLREVLLAVSSGMAPPEAAAARLRAADAEMQLLRGRLAALG